MKSNDKRRITAYHEAGHFVAAYVLGRHDAIYTISIRPHRDYAGVVDSEFTDLDTVEAIEDAVVELYAGLAAVLHLAPEVAPAEADWAEASSRDDDEKAAGFIGYLGQAKDETEARLRARAADLIAEHWHLVAALATDLLENETVDADEAEWVLQAAGGDPEAVGSLHMYRALKRASGA